MRGFLALLSFGAFLCYVGFAAAADEKACKGSTFVKIEECCSLPQVATSNVFSNCIGNTSKVSNKAAPGILQAYRSYNGRRGGDNGAACLINCVLGAQSLLRPDGEPDTAKIVAALSTGPNAVSKATVEEVSKSCLDDMAKRDYSKVTVPVRNDGTACKIAPGLYVTCLKSRLAAKNCVASKFAPPKEVCSKKLALLKACDPLEISSENDVVMFRPYRVVRKGSRGGKGG